MRQITIIHLFQIAIILTKRIFDKIIFYTISQKGTKFVVIKFKFITHLIPFFDLNTGLKASESGPADVLPDYGRQLQGCGGRQPPYCCDHCAADYSAAELGVCAPL